MNINWTTIITAIITTILGGLVLKMYFNSTKQQQKTGSNCTNIQTKGDFTIEGDFNAK